MPQPTRMNITVAVMAFCGEIRVDILRFWVCTLASIHLKYPSIPHPANLWKASLRQGADIPSWKQQKPLRCLEWSSPCKEQVASTGRWWFPDQHPTQTHPSSPRRRPSMTPSTFPKITWWYQYMPVISQHFLACFHMLFPSFGRFFSHFSTPVPWSVPCNNGPIDLVTLK